jgi:hypothetical protein
MKWSVMNVRARVIGFGVICVSVFAVMTMGIASCSDSVENEVSQEDSAVQSESPTNNSPGANENFQWVFYAVELRPQGSSGKLKVVQENKCKKHKHEGCLLFEEDEVGFIRFYLSGSEKMNGCNDEGTDKVITQIKLSTTGSSDDSNSVRDKGNFDVQLASWLKITAFSDVDSEGIVYERSKDDAKTWVQLINWNSQKIEEGEKQFWYKVTVTSCDGLQTWVTDPRGDNEGRN